MKTDTDCEIAIIGGGIIGICCAAYLAEAGKRVTMIDRTGICAGTSSGNAAGLAFSEVLPMAQKGMMAQAPKWLADPLGPLSVPPTYLPHLAPWLFRFWRAGRRGSFESGLAAQAAMMRLAEAEWPSLMRRSGTQKMLFESGSLELYESEREFRASLPGWVARERFGIDFHHLEKTEIAQYQPGLSDRFVRATFVPGWKTVADPQRLGIAVWDHAASKGADFIMGEVSAIEPDAEAFVIRHSGRGVVRAAKVVICAGAWSHPLARQFGDRIPLETERGYNTTLPKSAFALSRQLVFSGHGFVVTPLEDAVRVGGAVEFGGLRRPPNYARARAMLKKAKSFMPDLKIEGGREWMGYRPSLPDTLPVIGRSKADRRVFYAFGHGHLGLTQAAATGRLVRDLVSDAAAEIDLSPFSAQRF